MKNNSKSVLVLLLTAVIWGMAFVVQEESSSLGTFALTGIRFMIGCVVLIPIFFIMKLTGRKNRAKKSTASVKTTLVGGIICGVFLALGTNLQQFGIMYNARISEGGSGKAAFISALYMVFVAVFGIVSNKKPTVSALLGVVLAVSGLWFVSVTSSFTIVKGDILLLASAVAFALQIVFIDRFSNDCDAVLLSAIEFFTVGVLSVAAMFIFENPTVSAVKDYILPLLYMGVLSSGTGFTLQTVGQKLSGNPTVSSLLMSLESVFAMIAACVFYGKLPSVREAVGCLLMALAIVTVETSFADRIIKKFLRRSADLR